MAVDSNSWWNFWYRCLAPLVIYLLVSLVIIPGTVAEEDQQAVKAKPKLQYCTFFANRAPKIQLGLKNCTWFKENSCCRQEEIDAIFPRVKPLRGALPACQRYTNYLMCYVCAPNQNAFYLMESLTVCEEFCDVWYDACQTAILKGSVIRDLYSNGSEFCYSRRFKVQPASTGNCFFFDAKQDKSPACRLMISPFVCMMILFMAAHKFCLYDCILCFLTLSGR